MSDFARRIIDWQRAYGRHDLPWQRGDDPYRIWLSEVMLQQTQVATVLPYFARFVDRFPDLASLARAPLEEVMRLWSGLGYYSRARNLHRCAQIIERDHGGRFPGDSVSLQSLPGIGRSTAAAIAAFAFGERAAILDGNVKRVLCRVFGVHGFPGESAVLANLWAIAERELPAASGVRSLDASNISAYTQGLMDLGATLCTRSRPDCARCPVADLCHAHRAGEADLLPSPRPKRVTPERHVVFLVLLDASQVLLQERPESGIWGGLLSLPECEPGPADVLLARAQSLTGCRLRAGAPCPSIRHSFTHFRLNAQPVIFEVLPGAGERMQSAPTMRWVGLQEAPAQALPKPVRAFLSRLGEQLKSPADPPGIDGRAQAVAGDR